MRLHKTLTILLFASLLPFFGASDATTCPTYSLTQDTNYVGDGTTSTAAYQEWTANFNQGSDRYGGACGVSGNGQIHISDDDGNSVSESWSPGDTYTIWTYDYSWLETGDDVSVYFSYGTESSTELTRTMPRLPPEQPDNPEPAQSTSTSPVRTYSPLLNVSVTSREGENMDVTFYDGSGTAIDTDFNVNSGGTATVEWTGLSNDTTYDWSAEACDSVGCTSAGTWTFEVFIRPVEITSLDFNDLPGDHKFEATADFDTFSTSANSCEFDATFTDSSGTDHTLTYPGTLTGSNTCVTSNPIYYDNESYWENRHDNQGDLLNLDITAEVTDTSGNTDSIIKTHRFPNHQPGVEKISFSNYSRSHKFNTTAVLRDVDSNNSNQIGACSMNFSDGEGNYVKKDLSLNYSAGDQDEASCSYSNINSSVSGFDVYENIDVKVNVSDVHGSSSTSTSSNSIPNAAPVAVNPEPSQNGVVTKFPITLNATLLDFEGDTPLEAKIYNDSSERVSHETGVSSGFEIQGFQDSAGNPGKTYTWKVEVTDKYGATKNTTFNFVELIGSPYRSDVGLELNYSSIVLNSGDEEYVNVRINNDVDNTKDVTVNLTGVKAEFMDGTSVKDIPVFEGRSSREFTVRLTPDEQTDEDLTILVKNNDIGITTEKTLSVTTLENTQVSNEVPGIGLLHLLVLLSAATVLYSVRL